MRRRLADLQRRMLAELSACRAAGGAEGEADGLQEALAQLGEALHSLAELYNDYAVRGFVRRSVKNPWI